MAQIAPLVQPVSRRATPGWEVSLI